jgi:hypothetical protein
VLASLRHTSRERCRIAWPAFETSAARFNALQALQLLLARGRPAVLTSDAAIRVGGAHSRSGELCVVLRLLRDTAFRVSALLHCRAGNATSLLNLRLGHPVWAACSTLQLPASWAVTAFTPWCSLCTDCLAVLHRTPHLPHPCLCVPALLPLLPPALLQAQLRYCYRNDVHRHALESLAMVELLADAGYRPTVYPQARD